MVAITGDFRPLASDISSAGELAVDGMDPRRPWPPYAKLRALKPYTPAPKNPCGLSATATSLGS